MKVYGKGARDRLGFGDELMVHLNISGYAQMQTAIGDAAFLTPQDVYDLIEHLSEWLVNNPSGEEK